MPRKSIKADVDHCEFHTCYDDRTGKEIRTGPCNGGCRLHQELKGGWPLTTFLNKMMGYSDGDLVKADAGKAAKLFGINPEHATGYIRMERERRGIRDGEVRSSGKPNKRKRGQMAAATA